MWSAIKRLISAMRSAMSTITHYVTHPIRRAGEIIGSIRIPVFGASAAAYEAAPAEEFVEDMRPEREAEPHPNVAHEWIGSLARKAVAEMHEHGVVLDRQIPEKLRNWATALIEEEREVVLAATDLAVGRHIDGVEVLKAGLWGDVRKPDAERDAERAHEHAKQIRLREERRNRMAKPGRMAPNPAVAAVLGLRV